MLPDEYVLDLPVRRQMRRRNSATSMHQVLTTQPGSYHHLQAFRKLRHDAAESLYGTASTPWSCLLKTLVASNWQIPFSGIDPDEHDNWFNSIANGGDLTRKKQTTILSTDTADIGDPCFKEPSTRRHCCECSRYPTCTATIQWLCRFQVSLIVTNTLRRHGLIF